MITCQLMVALAAEAKPLIDHFGLKPERNQRFRSYTNGTISLVESGMGRLNAAAATASALERNFLAGQHPVCVNVGIAGADRAVGDLLVAHRIVDEATNQRWHPQLTAVSIQESIEVVTTSSPSTQYQAEAAFDMEAAGFIAAAVRYTSTEFIHSLKVISDNPQNTLTSLDKNIVVDLITAQLPDIQQTIEELSILQNSIPSYSAINQLIADCKQTMKISATQESALFRLLQRQQVIENKLPSSRELEKHPSIKVLLTTLSASLDNHSSLY